MDKLIRDVGCQRRPKGVGDQIQHHIQRRRAARTGQAVAVNFKQVIGDIKFGKLFGKPVNIFPMNGAAPIVQQASRRHDIGAGADGADNFSLPVQPPDRIDDGRFAVAANINPGAYQHHMTRVQHFKPAALADLDPVTGGATATVGAHHIPCEQGLAG